MKNQVKKLMSPITNTIAPINKKINKKDLKFLVISIISSSVLDIVCGKLDIDLSPSFMLVITLMVQKKVYGNYNCKKLIQTACLSELVTIILTKIPVPQQLKTDNMFVNLITGIIINLVVMNYSDKLSFEMLIALLFGFKMVEKYVLPYLNNKKND